MSITILFIICAAALIFGFFSGKIFYSKNKTPEQYGDTLHSLLVRITVLEDSLDNTLWHFNNLKKFRDSVIPETNFQDSSDQVF
ncbi:hypothetical protein JXL83_06535 [candidate division WOR-3 bacterium]|nr:hypothetical protein [candidate division WOR-3 bacterium]